ncbi:MAG: amino acid adenylation domain-containing protein [Acidobacteriota bacterium]
MAEDFSFPASFAQQRLWFLEQLDPGAPVYNLCAAARLRGPLSVEGLKSSIQDILNRHEALRTTFTSSNGQPTQVVHDGAKAELPVIPLEGVPAEERQQAALEGALQEAGRPFDLRSGPLLRTSLIRLGQADHVLVLSVHHIVFDGWSSGIFLRELSACYKARLADRPAQLADLPVQYVDFTHWQREWLAGPVLQQRLRYWKQVLSGAPSVLELPSDRPRPAMQSFQGRMHPFKLPGSLTERLRQLCRHRAVSLFMALTAAFLTLISRCTGRKDLVIGTPVANRDQPELQQVIGFFVNSLVLRVDLSGDPAFEELLQRVREAALGAYAQQDIPFEKLVEELKPDRDLSHNPIYQVVFGLQKSSGLNLHLEGLSVIPLLLDTGTSLFDLSIFMEDGPQGLGGVVEYSRDLFDAATVGRLSEQFRSLLEGAVADPGLPLSELPLLPPPQRHQLLVEWVSGPPGGPPAPLVVEIFQARAEESPHAAALVQQGAVLSYGELNRRANRLARHLNSLGVGAETPVGVFAFRSLDWIVALLGILKSGGAYLPVDPAYPSRRVAFLLEDAGAPVLLTQQALSQRLPANLDQVFFLDREWGTTERYGVGNPPLAAGPGNLAYVIYTSGSTGRPKGVMIQHDSLAGYNRFAIGNYAIGPGDRVLQFCSISFDISIEEIVPCLSSGAALVLRSDEMLDSMPAFLKLSAQWQLSVMSLPTAYWHQIVDSMEAASLSLPRSLRLVIIAGERAIPERLLAWRRRVVRRPRLVNTYGLTEATVISTLCDLNGPADEASDLREVSIGRCIDGAQLYLLDPHLEPVAAGIPGELWIGGGSVARGYRNRPAPTAERFVPDPFSELPGARLYRSGDLARFRPDANLEFIGRIDQQVKVRGYRIELGEIEAALEECPGVEKAVAAIREDRPGQKRLVGYLVAEKALGFRLEALGPEEGARADGSRFAVRSDRESNPPPQASDLQPTAPSLQPEELRSLLAGKLPEYMLPSAFVMLETLPLTPNGKVDRRALPAPEAQRPSLKSEYAAPRSQFERAIAEAWAEELGVDKVGRHDNFFDLGGHSMLMIQVQSRLHEAMGREVSILAMFKHPTVAALAQRLSEGSDEAGQAAAAEQAQQKALRQRAMTRDRFSRARRQLTSTSLGKGR